MLAQPAPSFGDGAPSGPVVYGPSGSGDGSAAFASAPSLLRFNVRNINVLGYLQGLAVMGVLRMFLLAVAVALIAAVLVRVVDTNATITGGASGDHIAGTTASSSGSGACRGLACEQAVPDVYRCRHPDAFSADVLTTADAWVVLGDEFAAGSASGTSWWSRLLSRTSAATAAAGSSTRIYNEAGPGVGQVANISLQVAALRRDRTAASILAHDSDERVVVFVGIGRDATSTVLPNTLGAMLDSVWGDDALVTSRTAHRMTVVVVVPPDPYWGDVEPSRVYRSDVVSTCGTAASWWEQKQWRQQTRDKLAVVAARNGAVLVELDAALGRFSLANDGTAFEARCAPSSRTPAYNQRGSYAAADVLWQCLQTNDGTYDVPKMLAS